MLHSVLRALVLVSLVAGSASAEAWSVGASAGAESQETAYLFFEHHSAELADLGLHGGYYVHPWIEPGVDLELGSGDGLRSLLAVGDVRFHLFPSWPVNPTVMLGAGAVDEHGTGAGASTLRFAVMAGPGVEVHVDRWTIGVEATMRLVRFADHMVDGSDAVAFTHDGLISLSAQARATYRF